ncbi:hypothetical protein ACI7YT_12675 [Microbacterium sp. M]|uniref:hypothetical protein n=1 Tax=Microbacterium sp. M TaxID=3377125 RepID=UPI00386970B6
MMLSDREGDSTITAQYAREGYVTLHWFRFDEFDADQDRKADLGEFETAQIIRLAEYLKDREAKPTKRRRFWRRKENS